jgi:uncharacterized membrane protein
LTSDRLGLWLHLLALATYFGSTVYLALVVVPAARRLLDAAARQSFLAANFKVYNPLTIGALGVEVMTGAFNLTSYKEVLRGEFYDRVGYLLAGKLALVFVLIMVATSISFGIGLRIVRHEEWREQLGEERLGAMSRRLALLLWLALVLTAAVTWIALRIGRPAL